MCVKVPVWNGLKVRILFALPEEAAPFVRRIQTSGHFPYVHASADWYLYYDANADGVRPYSLWVNASGVGMLNAAFMAERNVNAPRSVLLVAGFGGGLAAGLEPGSVVVADQVLNNVTSENFMADSTLLRAAESVSVSGVDVRKGLLVTTDRVLITPEEKQELAAKTGAVAVDMESAGAAAAVEKFRVPWLAVRVVTDGVEDAMPLDFNALSDADGNVNRKRVIAATLAHPWKIPALIRLGARSSKAANNLARFLEAFLQALPEATTKLESDA